MGDDRTGSDGTTPPPLTFEPHPLLLPVALHARFEAPLGELEPDVDAHALLGGRPPASVELDLERRELLRQDVRDLLRHGGHKPTGRGKPSCEYLVRAAGDGKIPRINAAVDACNAVSLHTGLPISVVDVARTEGPLRVAVPASGSYVFNASGQEIRLDGLLCLHDGTGPIANAVKDSHGTKTSPTTVETVSVLWAPVKHALHVRNAAEWYASLLEGSGARSVSIGLHGASTGEPVTGAPADVRWGA